MRYLSLLLFLFLVQGCQDERDCYTFLESECECNERQKRQNEPYCDASQYQVPTGVHITVGVYRCLSNQATLDQSRMPLINAGLDVSYQDALLSMKRLRMGLMRAQMVILRIWMLI